MLLICISADGVAIFTPYARPVILPSLLYFTLVCMRPKITIINVYLIIILIFILASNAIMNINDKSINYLIAYIFIIPFSYLFFRDVFPLFYTRHELGSAVFTCIIILSCLSVVETYFNDFWPSDIVRSWRFNKEKFEAVESVFEMPLRRSFLLSDEPTVLAMFAGALSFVYIRYVYNSFNSIIRILYILPLLVLGLNTFSSSFFSIFPILFFIYISSKHFDIYFKISIILPLFSLVFYIMTITPIENINFLYKILDFINSSRFQSYKFAYSVFQSSPLFGAGIGFISSQDTAIFSWWAMLLAELGMTMILILLPILAVTVFTFFKDESYSREYAFGGVYCILHLNTNVVFFMPVLFMLLGLMTSRRLM